MTRMFAFTIYVLFYFSAHGEDAFPTLPLRNSVCQIQIKASGNLSQSLQRFEPMTPPAFKDLWKLTQSGSTPTVSINTFENAPPAFMIQNITEVKWNLWEKTNGQNDLSSPKESNGKTKINGFSIWKLPSPEPIHLVHLGDRALICQPKHFDHVLAGPTPYEPELFQWSHQRPTSSSTNTELHLQLVLDKKLEETQLSTIKWICKVLGVDPLIKVRLFLDLRLYGDGKLHLRLAIPHTRGHSQWETVLAPRLEQNGWVSKEVLGEFTRVEAPAWPTTAWPTWIRDMQYRAAKVFGEEYDRELESFAKDFQQSLQSWLDKSFDKGLTWHGIEHQKENWHVLTMRTKETFLQEPMDSWLALMDFERIPHPLSSGNTAIAYRDDRGRHLWLLRPDPERLIAVPIFSKRTSPPKALIQTLLSPQQLVYDTGGQRFRFNIERSHEWISKVLKNVLPDSLQHVTPLLLQLKEPLFIEHYSDEDFILFDLHTAIDIKNVYDSMNSLAPPF